METRPDILDVTGMGYFKFGGNKTSGISSSELEIVIDTSKLGVRMTPNLDVEAEVFTIRSHRRVHW